jgi:hypothetical protein
MGLLVANLVTKIVNMSVFLALSVMTVVAHAEYGQTTDPSREDYYKYKPELFAIVEGEDSIKIASLLSTIKACDIDKAPKCENFASGLILVQSYGHISFLSKDSSKAVISIPQNGQSGDYVVSVKFHEGNVIVYSQYWPQMSQKSPERKSEIVKFPGFQAREGDLLSILNAKDIQSK